jgi:putative membrane protein insertion efficiency factor
MGHCHTSTQLCSHGKIFGADTGLAGAAAGSRRFAALAASARPFGAWLLLLFVRFYQIFVGPFLGGNCKFYPSCSHYAQEAIERHGARRGFVLAMKRLGRCRPFTQGGFDPVPDEAVAETGRGEPQ